MKREEIDGIVKEEIARIAPDADLATVGPDDDLRDAIDLDSMDFLHLVVALKGRLGVAVPESDYDRIRTLRGAVDYLAAAG